MRLPTHIYLDFDGVLHADGEPAIGEDFRLLDNPNLFCWLPILAELLAPFPDVKIVISSDWRRLFCDANLVKLLGPLGPRFAGVVEHQGASRADEILQDARHRGLETWISLDDHTSVHVAAANEPRFVPCDPARGISDPEVQARIKSWLRLHAPSPFQPQLECLARLLGHADYNVDHQALIIRRSNLSKLFPGQLFGVEVYYRSCQQPWLYLEYVRAVTATGATFRGRRPQPLTMAGLKRAIRDAQSKSHQLSLRREALA